MIDMNFTPWAQAVEKHLREQKNLIPAAASRAAGMLAYQGARDIRAQMRVTFKNPTQWTLNSVTHVEKSTRSRSLQALVPTDGSALVVFRETQEGAKQIGAGKYLFPQVVGGPRRQTRMERRLQLISPGGRTIYVMPTKYAERDGLGNLSSGWVLAVLSAVQALAGAGFNGNRRMGANMKRRAAVYGDRNFFVIWPGQSRRFVDGGRLMPNNLPPAIYQRFGEGRSSYIRPVFAFPSSAPRYHAIFDPVRIVQNTVDRRAAEYFFKALLKELPPAPSGDI